MFFFQIQFCTLNAPQCHLTTKKQNSAMNSTRKCRTSWKISSWQPSPNKVRTWSHPRGLQQMEHSLFITATSITFFFHVFFPPCSRFASHCRSCEMKNDRLLMRNTKISAIRTDLVRLKTVWNCYAECRFEKRKPPFFSLGKTHARMSVIWFCERKCRSRFNSVLTV